MLARGCRDPLVREGGGPQSAVGLKCMTVPMANYHMHAEDVMHTQWQQNMIRIGGVGLRRYSCKLVTAAQQLWEGGSG